MSPVARRSLAVGAAALVIVACVWLLRPAPSTQTPDATVTVTTPSTPQPRPAPGVVTVDVVVARPDVVAVVDVQTVAPSPTTAPEELVRGPWGNGPGQFGRRVAQESSPEAPMAAMALPDGELVVLDQVNGRLQRFRDGRFVGASPMGHEAAQDLAALPEGRVAVLDRLGDPSVTVLDRDGRNPRRVGLVGGAVTEGGAVTGVFADRDGVYVEREHREVVRVSDARGVADEARPTLWGRPTRDGRSMLRAAISDRSRGVVTVSSAARSNGAMDWATPVEMGAMVMHLVLLDSDASGRVYVAAVVAREDGARLVDARVVAVRLDGRGVAEARLQLPAPSEADELFRPLSVSDDGRILALSPSGDGFAVVAYRFE